MYVKGICHLEHILDLSLHAFHFSFSESDFQVPLLDRGEAAGDASWLPACPHPHPGTPFSKVTLSVLRKLEHHPIHCHYLKAQYYQ